MFDAGNDDRGSSNQFAEAFERASGFSKPSTALYIAWRSPLALFVEKGGTLAELREIFDRLIVESRLNEGRGTNDGVSERTDSQVSFLPSPVASRSGQHETVHSRQTSDARPAREPSEADRAALLASMKETAKSIFDTFKMRDGRAIGDVRYGELLRMETADRIEADVIRAIRKRGIAAHDTRIRDLVKPKVLATIIQNAKEKHNDQR